MRVYRTNVLEKKIENNHCAATQKIKCVPAPGGTILQQGQCSCYNGLSNLTFRLLLTKFKTIHQKQIICRTARKHFDIH